MNIAQRLDDLWGGTWEALLDSFRVSGQPRSPGGTPVVFIGESPHTNEVKSGTEPASRHALAGKSGRRVMNALDGLVPNPESDQPIRSIGDLATRGHVDWLTIINVSEVPLDPATYQSLIAKGDVTLGTAATPSLEHWLKLMYSFQLIRDNPSAQSRQLPFVSEVETHLKDDFCRRITSAVSENTRLVVLLGDVAKAYFGRLSSRFEVERSELEHPSTSENWKIPCEVLDGIRDLVRPSSAPR